jgi:hypothetical protein
MVTNAKPRERPVNFVLDERGFAHGAGLSEEILQIHFG